MKLKHLIRDTYNFKLGDYIGDLEHPDPKSLTVPGMAIPLPELINRLVTGREVPVNNPMYDGSIDLPDPRTMDKVEKELFAREVHTKIRELRNGLEKAEKEKSTNKIQDLQNQISKLKLEKEKSPGGSGSAGVANPGDSTTEGR